MSNVLTTNQSGGVILTTNSGSSWSSVGSVNSSTDRPSLAYGNGIWAYAKYNGGQTQYSSNNGTSWSTGTNIGHNTIDMCYGNGLFAASTEDGYIYTSPDGATWTQRTLPASGKNNRGIKWVGDKFICFPYNYGYVFYSSDGTSWSQQALAAGQYGASINWDTIAWDGTAGHTLVAVSRGSTNKIIYSTDGLSWTTTTTGTGTAAYMGVATNGTTFVAVCDSSTNGYYSTDGASWTAISLGNTSARYFSGIVWDGTKFIAPVLNSSVAAVSTTGSSGWSNSTLPSSTTWSGHIATDYTPGGAPTYNATQFFGVM